MSRIIRLIYQDSEGCTVDTEFSSPSFHGQVALSFVVAGLQTNTMAQLAVRTLHAMSCTACLHTTSLCAIHVALSCRARIPSSLPCAPKHAICLDVGFLPLAIPTLARFPGAANCPAKIGGEVRAERSAARRSRFPAAEGEQSQRRQRLTDSVLDTNTLSTWVPTSLAGVSAVHAVRPARRSD